MNDSDDVRVVDESERSRFEIRAGGELAGHAEYRLPPGRMVLTHTEVDDRFQGRGLAGRLARTALDSARERDLLVTPLCSYIADYIRKHPEYVSIVDEQHRSEFADVSE